MAFLKYESCGILLVIYFYSVALSYMANYTITIG